MAGAHALGPGLRRGDEVGACAVVLDRSRL